jgi:HK97 family phage portal protein
MSTKWKPSIIVKVDAMIDEFSSPEGRKKLMDEYISSSEAGEPWLIPAEQFDVETIKPLSLADLAISDSVVMDKRTVASIIGVPPFVLGVGEYDQTAWNSFINNTVRIIAQEIEQELTRKLILNPKWYVKFNILSLMNWDLQTIADVFGKLSDRGFVTGNEVRDRIGMSPANGLDEFRILENYIPYDMSALQKKLVQEGE